MRMYCPPGWVRSAFGRPPSRQLRRRRLLQEMTIDNGFNWLRHRSVAELGRTAQFRLRERGRGVAERARSHARRLALFVGVGLTNTAVDMGAFICLYELVEFDVISSNVIAFLLAVMNSYVLNRLITFADQRVGSMPLRGLGRFLVVAGAAMIVSTAIVYMIAQFAHPVIGKLVALVASTLINYIGCNRYVFTGERKV